MDVYTIITNKLIEAMEKGEAPWRKPWLSGSPINYFSRKPYSGVNLLLLPDGGEYCTAKQVADYNLSCMLAKQPEKMALIKPDAPFYLIVFWKPRKEKERDPKTGKEKAKPPVLRFYKVHHQRDVENLPSLIQKFEHNIIKEAQAIVDGYSEVPIFDTDLNSAFYSPSMDFINVPPAEQFPLIEEYFNTTFHEQIHSTGHPSRLNRFEKGTDSSIFGSKSYSFEELVAQIGAFILCAQCGIENVIADNSAAYLRGWIKRLENDKRFIFKAAAKAQTAANYVMGKKSEFVSEQVDPLPA